MKTLQARMAAAIKKRHADLNKLFVQLVQAKSENPPGDVLETATVIERFLVQEGIAYETFEPVPGHRSIVATVGKGEPSIILCGHIDVVPAGDVTKWSIDPYSATTKQGKLYGRGATDMKGGVTAMLMALAAVKEHENELAGKVTIACVPDEEAQGPAGVTWLMQNKKLTGDMCLITEPTGHLNERYDVEAGERGALWLRIISYGKPAHGSTPALGINAIDNLTQLLPKLKALETEPVKTPKDAEAAVRSGMKQLRRTAITRGIPASLLTKVLTHYTVNVGVISGGTKTNIVPERCEAEVDVRVPAGGSTDGVEELVRCLLPTTMELQIVNRTLPSFTPPHHPLIKKVQKSVKQVFGYNPLTTYMAATSDAHFFREVLDIPTASFGPGYAEMLHAYDEFVYLKDVQNAGMVYTNLIADTIG